jgi:hypothetical protein
LKAICALTHRCFAYLDFKTAFSDANSDMLMNVQITALPANGGLKLSRVNVTLNQNIATNNLGNLTFTGTANSLGSTTFGWKGTDSDRPAVRQRRDRNRQCHCRSFAPAARTASKAVVAPANTIVLVKSRRVQELIN